MMPTRTGNCQLNKAAALSVFGPTRWSNPNFESRISKQIEISNKQGSSPQSRVRTFGSNCSFLWHLEFRVSDFECGG